MLITYQVLFDATDMSSDFYVRNNIAHGDGIVHVVCVY